MLRSVSMAPCLSQGIALVSLAVIILLSGTEAVRGQQTDIQNGEDGRVIMSLKYYNPSNQSHWTIETLGPQSKFVVTVGEAPSDVHFYIFQAHAHLHNISLSYNQTLVQHNFIWGTNLGLVWKTKDGQGTFYVTNPNPENVTVMYAIVAYGAYSPVPGGCNMEFEVETSPYLKVWYSDAMVEVNAQPAQAPGSPCELDQVVHDMYRMFMPERDFTEDTYFEAIRAMLTPNDIIYNGTMTLVPIYGSIMRRLFSLYAGTGAVYVVVAHSLTGTSAYVPAVSYGCSAVFFSDSCTVLTTTFSKVLCACVFFLGGFSCFHGHTFFRTQIFLAGVFTGSLLSYAGFQQWTSLPFGSVVTLSCVAGLAVGGMCLLLWYLSGSPMLAIVLLATPLAFLMASLPFYIGLGYFQFVQLDLDFWLVFLLLFMTVQLLLLPLQHQASMVACAALGAYAIVLPVDHYLGGSLKYIIINTMRRASVPGFSLAFLPPPFQAVDGWLALLWGLLTLLGLRSQQIRHQGRPPFPPASRGPPPLPLPRPRVDASPTARTPIRVSSRIPYSYGSVGDDDVFETPPGAGAASGSTLPQSVAGWLSRGCGLRGR